MNRSDPSPAPCSVCGCAVDKQGDYAVGFDGDLLCSTCWILSVARIQADSQGFKFWLGIRYHAGCGDGFGFWCVDGDGVISPLLHPDDFVGLSASPAWN